MSDKDDSTTEKTSTSHLSLRVIGQDGKEVYFKIKSSTKLGKLMKAWCQRQSVSENSVRFIIDGERVNEDDTPESLELEDGDIIDAVLQQTGGGGRHFGNILASNSLCYFCECNSIPILFCLPRWSAGE